MGPQHCSTRLANEGVVFTVSHCASPIVNTSQTSQPPWPASCSPSQADSSGLPGVRSTLQARGFSPVAENCYFQSWRTSTKTLYRSYLHKRGKFCCERRKNPLSASLMCGINFLADMAAKNQLQCCQYGKICSFGHSSFIQTVLFRCLSWFCMTNEGYLRGKPKYNHIWDVSVVLSYCENLGLSQDLTLKQLSFRPTMLLALLSGQCCQMLQVLDITHMKLVGSECGFMLNCWDTQARVRVKHQLFFKHMTDLTHCVL